MLCVSSYSQTYTEYEVKAGYIYNFTKFIKWSASSFINNSYFIIGIYGNESFGKTLENVIRNKTILDKKWTIRYCKQISDIDGCNLLFVDVISKKEMIDILEYTNKKPVLTIGNNLDEFCENGGIINFSGRYYKKRFQINNEAAKRSGFYISSKLLILAQIINEDEIKF